MMDRDRLQYRLSRGFVDTQRTLKGGEEEILERPIIVEGDKGYWALNA